MACFDNIVSLKELCDPVTPFSGVYLNDVGVSKSLFEDVITKDYESIQDFVDSLIRQATREVSTTVYNHFSAKVLSRSFVENARTGYTHKDYETVAGSGYMGIEMTIPNRANYFRFELSSLSLHLTTSGSVDLLVYDLDQDKLLDTIPITSVAGEIVTVYPHTIYTSPKKSLNLWIGYDATGLSSIKTTVSSAQCCGNYYQTRTYTTSRGASVSGTFTIGNLSTLSHSAGISLTYSLSCDGEGWLCDYAYTLGLPVAYKVASELFRIGYMVSPNNRKNNSTILNADLLKENHAWHELKYRETMDALLKRIHLPNDSLCFECYSPVNFATAIP